MTGTLPTAQEVKFFRSKDSKSGKEIGRTPRRPAYAAWWATKLNDFRATARNKSREPIPARRESSSDWYNWVYKRVLEQAYDEIVEGIVWPRKSKPDQSYIVTPRNGQYHREKNPKDFAEHGHAVVLGPAQHSPARKKAMTLPMAFSVCASSALSATSTRLTNGPKPTSTRSRPSLSASPWAAKPTAGQGNNYRDLTNKLREMANYDPKDKTQNRTAPSGQWWRNAWRLASRCLGRSISAPNKAAYSGPNQED